VREREGRRRKWERGERGSALNEKFNEERGGWVLRFSVAESVVIGVANPFPTHVKKNFNLGSFNTLLLQSFSFICSDYIYLTNLSSLT
jgi:hypothetical protein